MTAISRIIQRIPVKALAVFLSCEAAAMASAPAETAVKNPEKERSAGGPPKAAPADSGMPSGISMPLQAGGAASAAERRAQKQLPTPAAGRKQPLQTR